MHTDQTSCCRGRASEVGFNPMLIAQAVRNLSDDFEGGPFSSSWIAGTAVDGLFRPPEHVVGPLVEGDRLRLIGCQQLQDAELGASWGCRGGSGAAIGPQTQGVVPPSLRWAEIRAAAFVHRHRAEHGGGNVQWEESPKCSCVR